MKIPKSLQETAAPLDPAPPEGGVEVHFALYDDPESPAEPRRFAGVFAAAPGLDELIEMEERSYRVTEVRRSVRGLAELKPDANGSLDAAYERLGKRGVPYADEIVFVLAEGEPDAPEAEAAP